MPNDRDTVRTVLQAARELGLPGQDLRRVVAAALQRLRRSAAANAREAARSAPDPAAEVAARRAAELAEAYAGAMAPFREAILAANSAEEAMDRVRDAYADWSPERVARLVEEALQISAAAGARDGKAPASGAR